MAAPALLEVFPIEMIEAVIRYLSTRDLAAFAATSKAAKAIAVPILFSLPTTSEGQLTTALEWTSKNGNDRSMTYLIQRSLKSIQRSPELQWDGLVNSCRAGFVDAVKALLGAGVSPNVEVSKSRRSKRFLVNHDFDMFNGTSALRAARLGNHLETMKLLVAAGVDFAKFDIEHTIELLYQPGDAQSDDATHEIAQYLIDNGLNIHQVDEKNNTLLHRVFLHRNRSLQPSDIALLLENGLDPSATNIDGEKPLYQAILWSSHRESAGYQIVKLMLNHGSQANELCERASRPLHVAAMGAPVQIINLLLEKGADANGLDGHRMTPLGHIGRCSSWSTSLHTLKFKALISGGASLTVSPFSTAELITRAIEREWPEFLRLILDSPEVRNDELPRHNVLFMAAAALGDVPKMERMLNSGLISDVDFQIAENTPLHIAVKWQQREAVELLIPRVKDLDACDGWGCSALFIALGSKSEEIIRLLLPLATASALQVKELTRQMSTPLEVAIHAQPPHVLEVIMQRLQDFPEDLPKFTKLILKALTAQFMVPSNLQVLDVVLDYLVRFQVPIETDEGILSWAMRGRFEEEALKLINSKLPLADPEDLIDASRYPAASIVEALINKGIDMNYVGFRGRSAVYKAVAQNRLENLKLLVEAGADLAVPIPEEVEEEGLVEARQGNLLLLAAFHGYIDIVKFLLEHGLDVNSTSSEGRTALAYAAAKGHVDVVRLLLDHDAEIDITENCGITALYWACIGSRFEIAELLLDKGAQLTASDTNTDNTTKPPLSWTNEKSPLIIETYHRINNTFPGNATLFAAVQGGNATIVQLLLDRGATKKLSKPDNRYILHYAAHRKAAGVVKVLVRAGCDPILADGAGFTPVFYSDEDGDTVGGLYSGRG
ncbi:ankyrin repeat-containing domain protein [Aspergillus stella-maris]|uniref:ankyrin repeat-containing domain protein n=1 Tax=Aspergillus stella-maris TaxID=1810926 RepID=UPI003CCCD249